MEFANVIGTTTFLKLDWKSWKDELPPAYQQIFVILRLDKGYYPVTAEFLDPKNFKVVKFDDFTLPDCYLESKEGWRLHAWAKLKKIDAPLDSQKSPRRRKHA
jgi:hypothetical protein